MSHAKVHRTKVSILVLLVLCLAAAPLHAQTSQKLAASVQPFVDRQELAGAVMLVADKDKVLATAAVGWADMTARQPMQTDSMFWIASQSKPITAAALMTLVDEGKVNVDDPVERYLPEFRGQMVVAEKDAEHTLLRRPKHPITVKNVLSHTSGLPFKSALEEPTLDLFPLLARVRSYAMTPPEVKNSYGFGFAVGPTSFGHGGAYSTNSTADTQRGLILVWLVQHAGFPGDGKKSQEAFKQVALEAFTRVQE